ncbi:MAG: hypothetical protein ACE5OZ_17140 [Candidatus Heimdallarchaeota archaeon]
MSHEDWMLDAEFQVESATDFLAGLSPDEERFLLQNSDMTPCGNCGEWVTKRNLRGGFCTLCRKSEHHEKIRGESAEAGENYHSLEALVKRFEELRT